jgi:flagellar hook-associated protein 3 FlgL
MRISNALLYRNLSSDVATAMANTQAAQRQVSTGRKFQSLSEDPLNGLTVIRSERGLRALDQYRRTSSTVRTRLDTEDAVLSQILDLLDDAKGIALAQGSSTASTETRMNAATSLDGILAQLTSLGNTRVGNEYLFGGTAVTAPPFTLTGSTISYNGDTGVRQAEVGEGYVMAVNHNGDQLMMASNLGATLTQLRADLAADNAAGVASAADSLSSAFDAVQVMQADVGARSRQLDSALATIDAVDATLTSQQDDAWSVDIAEATVRLATAQSSLQSALLAATKVLNTNLTEYLS